MNGRPSFTRSAYVVARRDYLSMLLNKGFLFLLLVPVFAIAIIGISSVILISGGNKATESHVVFDMAPQDAAKIRSAYERVDQGLLRTTTITRSKDKRLDAATVIEDKEVNVSVVVQGTVDAPIVYVGEDGKQLMPQVRLLVAEARSENSGAWKDLKTIRVGDDPGGRILMSGAGDFLASKILQFALYIVISTMASMVLSTLTEEKSNRLVEILSTAMPIQALFAGKLMAMLAITLTAFAIWGAGISLVVLSAGLDVGAIMPNPPPLGWATALALFGCYFIGGYLLVGSLYLALGGLAATPRDAQIYALPVAFLQILSFLVGSWASTEGGNAAWIAAAIPMVSPFVLVGMAVEGGGLAIHIAGIAWQLVTVAIVVHVSAAVFKRNIVGRGAGRKARKPRVVRDGARNETPVHAS